MGRENASAAFDPRHLASAAEAEHFDEQTAAGRCCTISSFRVDLNGPPRSDWNRSAFKVFLPNFLDRDPVTRDEEQIKTAFFHHIRTLKRQMTSITTSQEELNRNRRSNAQYQRRKGVSTPFSIAFSMYKLTINWPLFVATRPQNSRGQEQGG